MKKLDKKHLNIIIIAIIVLILLALILIAIFRQSQNGENNFAPSSLQSGTTSLPWMPSLLEESDLPESTPDSSVSPEASGLPESSPSDTGSGSAQTQQNSDTHRPASSAPSASSQQQASSATPSNTAPSSHAQPSSTAPSSSAAPPPSSSEPEPVRVNINTASASELQQIPGVFNIKATAIITYREQHGPFGSVDDLLNVPGIGSAFLDSIRPYVYV